MKTALWILGGILAFNVFVVLAFFAYAIPKRRAVERRRLLLVEPAAALRPPHNRRAIAVVAVAAVLVTGTALANPATRDAVTAMVDTVAQGLQIAPAEEVQDAQAGPRIQRQRPEGAGAPSDAPSATRSQSAGILPSPQGPDGGASSPSGMGAAAPAGPATVTATTTSSSSIVVRWVDVMGETGFRVERSADGIAGWVQISSTDRGTTVSEDTGLAADTTYYYRVFSTNAGVDSAASAVASATTGVDPASPTTVTASSTSSHSIRLDWNDVGNETGYRVESSADGETGWTTIATTGQDVTRFVDTDLGPSEVHYYRVFATNAGGDSSPSGVVKAETTGPDPGTPSP